MRTTIFCSIFLTFISIFIPPILARTWYVKLDGTGDAPTIQAGIDSAEVGDIVLVGEGDHKIPETIILKAGVILISEDGPMETKISRGAGVEPLFGIDMRGGSEINGFNVQGFPLMTIMTGESVKIKNNIISSGTWCLYVDDGNVQVTNNLFLAAGKIFFESSSTALVFNNIILCRTECISGANIIFICNDIIGEVVGCNNDWTNFNLDPQFCGVTGSSNYYLQGDSPCAPGNHPHGENYYWCGLIGPMPVGCGTVPTKPMTWGAIKSIYNE